MTIGDSLTAEYDTIPEVPDFINLPTDYAKVTVASWESMSWVEVVRRLKAGYFNFGGYKSLPDLWSVPRMSGFEYNWGIPGATSTQYAEFVTSSLFSNPAYYALRQPLEAQLKNTATRVVIWLGANDFREAYGTIYDGGGSDAIVSTLVANIARIIDFVRRKNPTAQIVLANVPDLGATPAKKVAHPDPVKRARVSAATRTANTQLAALAAQKGIPVADVHALSANLINKVPFYIGPVRIANAMNANNSPRYAFTRDGLHPNTAGQISNARSIIAAFNQGYSAAIPQITDTQALALLGFFPGQSDFSGDGKPDILWQHAVTGERTIWFMNGATHSGGSSLGQVDPAWQIAGPGDFNGDGKPDIAWQNTATGARSIWFMNGAVHTTSANLDVVPVGWQIAAIGDFNGDGKPDLVSQNTVTGARNIRFMNGTTPTTTANLGTVPVAWQIAGADDFNGDGRPDLVWQDTVTGERTIWFMNGAIHTGSATIGVVPVGWQIAGTGDFNSDGKPDLLWQDTVTGARSIWFMNGAIHTTSANLGVLATAWQICN